jgi:hypothetical protein
MRQMESAFDAFGRHEERLQQLSLRPSEYVRRQMRFTPYPTEDVGWIIDQAGPETVLFNEIGNENAEIRTLFEASYLRMKKMLETRLIALSRLKKLPLDPNREVIAEKACAILASLVGAVALAKSLPGEQEREHILNAAQRNILQMLGVDESELESMLGEAGQESPA